MGSLRKVFLVAGIAVVTIAVFAGLGIKATLRIHSLKETQESFVESENQKTDTDTEFSEDAKGKTEKIKEEEIKQKDTESPEVSESKDNDHVIAEDQNKQKTKGEYPYELQMSKEELESISSFIELLGNTDCKMCGGDGLYLGEERIIKTQGTEYFGYSFLYMTFYNAIPFVEGQAVEPQIDTFYCWKAPQDIVEEYLRNSINNINYKMQFQTEYSPYIIENGEVGFSAFDPNSMWSVEKPTIHRVMAVSQNEIRVQGTINYINFESGQVTNRYEIQLISNPKSMWGGYTLENIVEWTDLGQYILAEAADRYYTEAEIDCLPTDKLALARNEIYARHGYIFHKQELTDYFSKQPWYQPLVTEVPDSELNEYEKANLKLIQEKEEQRK